jgi:hypothetical protein
MNTASRTITDDGHFAWASSYAQVIYRVVPLKDGTFEVEIEIPGTWPSKSAQSFLTKAEAEV